MKIGPDGRTWCMAGFTCHGKAKCRYSTIEEAWRVAFLEFHRIGAILTPYKCNTIKRKMSHIEIKPHPNPWSWLPYLIKTRYVSLKRRDTCGGWHLCQIEKIALNKGQ